MKSTDPCLKKMKALSEGGQSSFSAWLLHLSLDNTILIVKALSLVGPTKVNTWNVFWTFVERVLVLEQRVSNSECVLMFLKCVLD
jgi:hypothetical protein